VSDQEPDSDESLGGVIGRVMEDGKAYAEAEIAYYRALAAERFAAARGGLYLGIAALVLVQGAAIALIVGLVLSLAVLTGPLLATLIVVLVTAGIAALLGWLAYQRVRTIFADPRKGDGA